MISPTEFLRSELLFNPASDYYKQIQYASRQDGIGTVDDYLDAQMTIAFALEFGVNLVGQRRTGGVYTSLDPANFPDAAKFPEGAPNAVAHDLRGGFKPVNTQNAALLAIVEQDDKYYFFERF